MKRILSALSAAAFVAGTPLGAALSSPTEPSTFSKSEENNFYSQLEAGLKKSQEKVQRLQAGGANIQNEMALEAAQSAFAIKKTMLANFRGTPALQFPEIRQRLLTLFQKDEVTAEDLALLQQAIYDWEKSNKQH